MRTTAGVELYWLPLGAGGWFVRQNGRIWEAIHARLEHRRPLDLYHTALLVRVPEGRFVVNCWPIPNKEAVASPQLLSGDPMVAHRLLELVHSLPSRCGGRDELRTGEMWNSNSVIAWLLARSGLPTDAIRPLPEDGRQAGRPVAPSPAASSTATSAPSMGSNRVGRSWMWSIWAECTAAAGVVRSGGSR